MNIKVGHDDAVGGFSQFMHFSLPTFWVEVPVLYPLPHPIDTARVRVLYASPYVYIYMYVYIYICIYTFYLNLARVDPFDIW